MVRKEKQFKEGDARVQAMRLETKGVQQEMEALKSEFMVVSGFKQEIEQNYQEYMHGTELPRVP